MTIDPISPRRRIGRGRASGAGADAAAVGLLVALTGLVVWDRFRFDRALDNVDILTQFVPLYTMMAEQIRDGMLPAWNPSQFSGVPLAADPLSGWLSLSAMPAFLLFPPVAAYKVHIVVNLLLAGLGAYALGRVLGLGVLGAAVAGVAYEFGPHVHFSTCCTTQMQLGAWLPAALLGVELAARARTRAAMVGWWGLSGFAVSQMLTGWFGKGSMYALVIVATYIAYRIAFGGATWPTTSSSTVSVRAIGERCRAVLVHGVAIGLIGLGLSAGTLLPRLDYLERTNLDGGEYERVAPEAASTGGWRLPTALDRVANPRYLRWYVAGVTLGLAVAAPLLAGRRYGVPYFALSSVVVFLLTTRAGPLHDLFYLIPRFQTLHEHVPSRILTVGNLGVSLLAGASVAAITDDRLARRVGRRRVAWLAPLIALIGLTAALERDGFALSETTRTALVFVIALLLLAALPDLLGRWTPGGGARRVRMAAALLLLAGVFWNPVGETLADDLRTENPRWERREVVVAAFLDGEDAGGAGAFLRDRAATEHARYLGYDARFLPPEGRLLNYHAFYTDPGVAPLLVANRSVLLGLQDVQGYNPVHPRAYDAYVEAMNGHPQEYHESAVFPSGLASPLLDLLNVRYVVVPSAVPPGRPDLLHLNQRFPVVYADARVRVLENRGALPRAWLVHDTRVAEPDEALRLLAAGEVDPATTVLLQAETPVLREPVHPESESVAIASYAADAIDLRVRAETDGLVVMSETWDPDWRAYVDGEPVEVLHANHLFRAVPVPAGDHTVEFRYEPRALTAGLAVTGGTGVLLVSAVAGLAAVDRRRRPEPVARATRPARVHGGSRTRRLAGSDGS